jgi:hypothetical protein
MYLQSLLLPNPCFWAKKISYRVNYWQCFVKPFSQSLCPREQIAFAFSFRFSLQTLYKRQENAPGEANALQCGTPLPSQLKALTKKQLSGVTEASFLLARHILQTRGRNRSTRKRIHGALANHSLCCHFTPPTFPQALPLSLPQIKESKDSGNQKSFFFPNFLPGIKSSYHSALWGKCTGILGLSAIDYNSYWEFSQWYCCTRCRTKTLRWDGTQSVLKAVRLRVTWGEEANRGLSRWELPVRGMGPWLDSGVALTHSFLSVPKREQRGRLLRKLELHCALNKNSANPLSQQSVRTSLHRQ